MFQGAHEKLKEKNWRFNDNSSQEWFIFSQADLRPTYQEISGKSHVITLTELKQKLEVIIQQQKK